MRYRIFWYGRQLAIISAVSPETAVQELISKPGYTYLTPPVLRAEPISPVQRTDAFGNTFKTPPTPKNPQTPQNQDK